MDDEKACGKWIPRDSTGGKALSFYVASPNSIPGTSIWSPKLCYPSRSNPWVRYAVILHVLFFIVQHFCNLGIISKWKKITKHPGGCNLCMLQGNNNGVLISKRKQPSKWQKCVSQSKQHFSSLFLLVPYYPLLCSIFLCTSGQFPCWTGLVFGLQISHIQMTKSKVSYSTGS